MVSVLIFLVTTASAALANNGFIHESNGLDLDSELPQERYEIDDEEKIVNKTEFQRNDAMENSFDHWASMPELRKRCTPIKSCTRAGGFCFKKRKDCNGTVDRHGCRGSKKCKCCIPDGIVCLHVTTTSATPPAATTPAATTPAATTPAATSPAATTPAATTPAAKTPAATTPAATTPVATTPAAITPAATTPAATTPAATTPATTTPAATTPAATTPAATTPAATTPAATTPAATTPAATTPAATTPAATTPAATTTSATTDPNLSWLTAGVDRFIRFDQKLEWNSARNYCKSLGLDIYQPRNSTVVSKYLEENFNERYQFTWLGARGNGTHMVWVSGDVLTAYYPWADAYTTYSMKHVGTDACLWMVSNDGWYESGKGVLVTENRSCGRSGSSGFYALCG